MNRSIPLITAILIAMAGTLVSLPASADRDGYRSSDIVQVDSRHHKRDRHYKQHKSHKRYKSHKRHGHRSSHGHSRHKRLNRRFFRNHDLPSKHFKPYYWSDHDYYGSRHYDHGQGIWDIILGHSYHE